MKQICLLFIALTSICHNLYAQSNSTTLKGTIRSETSREPLPAATIQLPNTQRGTITDNNGRFSLVSDTPVKEIIVSCIGYQSRTIELNTPDTVTIYLKPQINSLDATIVTAYGTTTKRLGTGNISVITAEEIGRQPVSNILATLEGNIPGLVVNQSNGLPGSNYGLQIRGRNSLSQGTQPLYIVDGVPFVSHENKLSQISPLNNQSPLNLINPADIESISILKDADATAIYGSQGANGAILITTKSGKRGKPKFNINIYTGIGKVTRNMNLMNTKQYLMMRREAFQNDRIEATPINAPDLLSWDTTSETDWTDRLIGGTAKITNIEASVSGGTENTQIRLSANHYRETSVFPESRPATRNSIRLNINQQTKDNRLRINTNILYSQDIKKLPYTNLTPLIFLPPNAPKTTDSMGNLNWDGWISGLENPMSYLLTTYRSQADNININMNISYDINRYLSVKINAGYNTLHFEEESRIPIKSQRPSPTTTGTFKVGLNNNKTWIIEPQIIINKRLARGNLNVLVGSSFQQKKAKGYVMTGSRYKDDDLLGDIAAAGELTANSSEDQYNYAALFGRAKYSWRQKYLINANIRKDGSSRFSPENRFSTFSSLGAAWIFTREPAIKQSLPFLSFGKIRGSYGVTGNDQIGNYQYLDSWSTSYYPYNSNIGLLPDRLYNPAYEWERTKKLEIGLEIGVFADRVLLTNSFYHNESDNQLLRHTLPHQTGFTNIIQNLDAVIQNTGWEVEIISRMIQSQQFGWTAHLNFTLPKSKLVKYPNLEESTDRYKYEVGKPLNIRRDLLFTGVDEETGIYTFQDIDKDGKIKSPGDLTNVGTFGTEYYGGFTNRIQLNNWEMSFLIQFVKQTGTNYLVSPIAIPGMIGNQPTLLLGRWQKKGDKSSIQRYTASTGTDAYNAYRNLKKSSGALVDASYMRMRNLKFSYLLPKNWCASTNIRKARIYLTLHNLFTLTNYQGADPETQSLSALPPLKRIIFGIQLTF